jgi:hypothetical protein
MEKLARILPAVAATMMSNTHSHATPELPVNRKRNRHKNKNKKTCEHASTSSDRFAAQKTQNTEEER